MATQKKTAEEIAAEQKATAAARAKLITDRRAAQIAASTVALEKLKAERKKANYTQHLANHQGLLDKLKTQLADLQTERATLDTTQADLSVSAPSTKGMKDLKGAAKNDARQAIALSKDAINTNLAAIRSNDKMQANLTRHIASRQKVVDTISEKLK